MYDKEKEKLDAYWFGTSNPFPNGIEKLPLMVSQWPPVLPEWSNLVQFDFRPKHPVPARDSPLRRESSTKCAHGVVMHHTGGFQQSDQKAARWWWGWSQTRPIPRSPDGDNNRGMKSESGFSLAMQWRASPLAQTHYKHRLCVFASYVCVIWIYCRHILFVEVVTCICWSSYMCVIWIYYGHILLHVFVKVVTCICRSSYMCVIWIPYRHILLHVFVNVVKCICRSSYMYLSK